MGKQPTAPAARHSGRSALGSEVEGRRGFALSLSPSLPSPTLATHPIPSVSFGLRLGGAG